MTVVAFRPRAARRAVPEGWSPQELPHLLRLTAFLRKRYKSVFYETAFTDDGEPQFFVLRCGDEMSCVGAVSRLNKPAGGTHYIYENGAGRIMAHGSELGAVVASGIARRVPAVYIATVQRLVAALTACELSMGDDLTDFVLHLPGARLVLSNILQILWGNGLTIA
jgi:hypothetical protein